ncbi:BNR repeat-like domain-containing protein [Arenibacter palladensis]|uniref:BNR repeat-like domain-containing protein n=1 Tax=Arenibacter palladensis TaxID=237373 RepID=A0A1M5BFE5_9FLAO|nr:sialidase family protein [Arenibacter palladensis]SHF41145.1 BNR repeat-like domain-containing protein [Arenibacter palladensis]
MNKKILPSTILIWVLLGIAFSCKTNKANNKISDSKGPETVLSLRPSADNPRNSEGDFIRLKNGNLLFVYTHYTQGSGSDHDPAHLASRYSEDNGNTWSAQYEVVLPNEGGMNVMSVSLLRLQNGAIALFYLRKNSTVDCIPMMRISTDEAKSWSSPIPCITDKEGYFVLNNDRVIQLEDGRLMFAVAEHPTTEKGFSARGNLFSYYSDDNGETWTSSEMVPNNTEIITQEPGLIELNDGRIMMYIRASGGVQQLSFSEDRGASWSHIEPSAIYSPLSPATIEKVPGTKNWVMVWNNNDGSDTTIKGKRTPLTIAISKDEGKTWVNIKNIATDPEGWYCYTALYFTDPRNLILGHCAGNRVHGTGLAVTDLTTLNLDWIVTPQN